MGWSCRKKNGRYNICIDSRCPEIGGEMEAKKTRNCDGDCIKIDIERVGEEWDKIIDRRNWRLLTENVVREK